MKVSDILNEGTWDEDRGEYYPSDAEQRTIDSGKEAAKEEFHNNYEELGGSTAGGYEDAEYVMKEVLAKKRDADFREAEKVIGELNAAFDKNVNVYVPKNIEPRLDQLWEIINKEDMNPTIAMKAIQEFFALIGKHMTTKEAWMDSEEAQGISSAAQAEYDSGDEYARRGLKRSDFY